MDRMSEIICNPGTEALNLDAEVLWLDVLAHEVVKTDDEFLSDMEQVAAQREAGPDEGQPFEDFNLKLRFLEARAFVACLTRRGIIHKAPVPVTDWEPGVEIEP